MSKTKSKLDMSNLSIWYRLKGTSNWTVDAATIGAPEEKFKKALKEFVLKGYEVKVVQVYSLSSYFIGNIVDNYVDKLFDVREINDDFAYSPEPETQPLKAKPAITDDEDEEDEDIENMLKRLNNRGRKR